MSDRDNIILRLIDRHSQRLLSDWLEHQRQDAKYGGTQREAETSGLARRFLGQLRASAQIAPFDDVDTPEWQPIRELLEDLSRDRAVQGFSPTETATFIFSLKEPLFALLREELRDDPERLVRETWTTSRLIDSLGLYTIECYARTREEVIRRQQQELLELSTPVVELWEGILALPLIGTLDSARTQIVMESLLQHIVEFGCRDRHHRHHGRADGRYPRCPAPDQDDLSGPVDGSRLHPQWHSSTDRTDNRTPRPRTQRHFEGDHGGRARTRAAPLRQNGHRAETAGCAGGVVDGRKSQSCASATVCWCRSRWTCTTGSRWRCRMISRSAS